MTLLCGQSSNLFYIVSLLDFINSISHRDDIQDVNARIVDGKVIF